MFSRINGMAQGAAVLLCASVLASCTLPLNEKAPIQEPPATKIGFESQCLKGVLPVMREFAKGDARPEDVAGVWRCFGGALDLFYKKVRGSSREVYAPREVATFFEDYFLSEVRINDRLLGEIMRLKKILVGGDDRQITREELRRLMSFAEEAEGMSLRVLPYMKVFSLNWQPGSQGDLRRDLDFFEEANREIQATAKQLGDRIASNGQGYELDHLPVLLDEIEKLYGENWKFLDQLDRVFPLVYKLKTSLVGGEETVVAASEWRPFHLLLGRGYIQYLRYHYFIEKSPEGGGGRRIVYIFNSIDDLFSYMGDMVREKPTGSLSKDELKEVARCLKGLFPDLEISGPLIDEAMKIKQLVFGGSQTEFHPGEFDLARTKVDGFRHIAEKGHEYLPFYTMEWDPSKAPASARKDFEAAEANLLDLAVRLGGLLETSYDLRGLSRLAHEVGKTFPREEGPTWGELVDKYLDALVVAKNIALNDQTTVVAKSQWPDFLKVSGQVYGRVLFHRYFMREIALTRGRGLDLLTELIDSSLLIVDQALDRRSRSGDGLIRFEELDRVLVVARELGMLPGSMRVPVLQPLVRVVLKKFLVRPELRLAGRAPNGLSKEATRVARAEYGAWVKGQKLVERMFGSQNGLTGPEILRHLRGQGQSLEARELRMSMETPVPLTFDDDGRWYFSANRPVQYTPSTMYRINLARLIARLVIQGYAGEMSRITSYAGFTKAEANELFRDVREFAIDLGLLDRDNTTFAESRFLEANLFAPHADGNEIANYAEGVDLVLLIMSGLQLDKSMKAEFNRSCRPTSAQQERDRRIQISCFLSSYRRQFSRIFTSMPEFSAYADRLSDSEFDSMMINFLKATGWIDDRSGTVRIGDTALVPHVIQYAEAVLHRFDSDRNGVLNRPEALSGYPLFRGVLLMVSGFDSDKILKGAYAYVLVHGKMPETLAEKMEFMAFWINREDSWPIEADRKRLAQVLGYIADQVAKKKEQELAERKTESRSRRDRKVTRR